MGKSSETCSNFREEVEGFVKQLDKQEIYDESPVSIKIDRDKILRFLNSLKVGKACGDDGIPNEFLKFGGDAMINSLVRLFVVITDIEMVPRDWQEGIIKPILKGGSCFDLDNYRGITLTSNVYKLFCKVIEDNLIDYIESNNLLGEEQGAFRKDRRTEDNLFTLHGVCSLRKAKRDKTYLAFLDLSRAFDRVWRDGLFYLLWKSGIQGKCWRILRSLYSSVSNKILFATLKPIPLNRILVLNRAVYCPPLYFRF